MRTGGPCRGGVSGAGFRTSPDQPELPHDGRSDHLLTAAGLPLDVPLGVVQVAPRGADRIPIHGGPGQAGILNLMITQRRGAGLVPVHGTSYIQVVSFEPSGPVADALLSYSPSSDPASVHSHDQTRAFSAKKWHRLPFTRDEIRRAALGPGLRLRD